MDNKVNGAGTVTGRDDNKFEIKNLNLHYGDFHLSDHLDVASQHF